jgi:two-component system cell cycle response regulator DivK
MAVSFIDNASSARRRHLKQLVSSFSQTRNQQVVRIGERSRGTGRAGGRSMTYQDNVRSFENRSAKTGGARKTVLIVEDNELNLKLFNDLLDAYGYATLQARGGIEALTIAREHGPNLILMDIQLPEVSGLEVTKWLKDDDRLREIPVIAVTAFAMKGDEERIRQGGCEAYISKPITIGSFIDTVRRFIGDA